MNLLDEHIRTFHTHTEPQLYHGQPEDVSTASVYTGQIARQWLSSPLVVGIRIRCGSETSDKVEDLISKETRTMKGGVLPKYTPQKAHGTEWQTSVDSCRPYHHAQYPCHLQEPSTASVSAGCCLDGLRETLATQPTTPYALAR
jgi:hypothetical protein